MNSTSAATSMATGTRSPFTMSQWQELEHQALIFKYLMAGLPIPPDLVLPIQKSFDPMSPRFFHHPTSMQQQASLSLSLSKCISYIEFSISLRNIFHMYIFSLSFWSGRGNV